MHYERRHLDGTIYRHNNAPHHRQVKTFPKHYHKGREDFVVESYLPDEAFKAFKLCIQWTKSPKCLSYVSSASKVIDVLKDLPCPKAKPYIMKIFLKVNLNCVPNNSTLKVVEVALKNACPSIKEITKPNVNAPSERQFLVEAEKYFTECLYSENKPIYQLLDYCSKQALAKVKAHVLGNVTAIAQKYATYLYEVMKRDYLIYSAIAPWLSQCGINAQVKVPNLKLLVKQEISKVCSNLTGSQPLVGSIVVYAGVYQASIPKELSDIAKLKQYLLEPNSLYQKLAKSKGPLADQARKAMLLQSDLIAMMLRANAILDQFLRDYTKFRADNETLVELLSKPVTSYDQLYAIYTKFMELKLDYVNMKGDWEQLGKQLKALLNSIPTVDVSKVKSVVGDPKEFLVRIISKPPTGWELFKLQRKLLAVGGIRGVVDAYLAERAVESYSTYLTLNTKLQEYFANMNNKIGFYKELVSTISSLK